MKTAEDIKTYRVPAGHIALWWLGQAGFIIKSPAGKILALDPYLSNSCKALGEQIGLNMDRMVPAPITPADLLGIDAYLFTHSHQDHLDPETLDPYRAAGGTGPYLAPAETAEKLHARGIPAAEIEMVWPNKQVVIGDITLRPTFAIPFAGDDLTHVGYLVAIAGGPTVYFTGDTAYHDVLSIAVAGHKPDVMVAVINPAFRNLSPAEAARLAQQLDVKAVIPCHYDLFPDNQQPPQMLRTNLFILGLADRYRALAHGRRFSFPETP